MEKFNEIVAECRDCLSALFVYPFCPVVFRRAADGEVVERDHGLPL